MTARRRDNNDLLFGLAIAIAHEHKTNTGHEWERRLLNPCCDVCMWMRVVFDELEAREYDERASLAPEGKEVI